MKKEDRVQSIKLTDNDTNETYELDFSRESIRFAEARGFKVDEVVDFPVTKFPEFFYYAFRMHHKNLSRTQTDALYEKLGGYTAKFLERLIMLYNQAALANNIVDDEDAAKNARMTVEM